MPVNFNANATALAHLSSSDLHEEENRMWDIIDAVGEENLPRVREIIYFGNPTENEINQDKKIVLLEAMSINKFGFFRTFLERDDVSVEVIVDVVKEAVKANSLQALEILLQNDLDNALRGLAVIYAAHGYGTLECIHWLLHGYKISASDLYEAIGNASNDEIRVALKSYVE